ncbi:MAG: BMP family ABC transporter substrate-binding protein [Eubacteriales bacterium]|nr:BMP family ABC transporter substrate-binding protein [Eubacteriales bacterium]
MKKKLLSVLVTTAMAAALLAGCGGSSESESSEASGETKDVKDLVIGEIHYSVVEDGGWAQGMHEGIVTACENLGIDTETNLLTMEEIAEEDTALVESTVEELVDNGADIIFGCSAGYATILAELQEEYPDVIFAQQGNDVYDNIVEFQIRGYEGDFLTGYLCALMNEGSDELGFCASMDEASVRTAVNSFALGAKYANPNAKVQVVWADSWYDLDIESQNAKTLIDKGIKYMGMEASSPAVPQTCEENGAFCIGYNVDMEASAPGAVLTSFVWNWAPIFEDIMQKTADGTIEISANYYEGGECAALAPFNADLVPEEIQKQVEELKEKVLSGEVAIYGGELKNDKGEVLVEAGEVMSDEDILAQDFFVENVIGGKN